jgi:hypothetical protein
MLLQGLNAIDPAGSSARESGAVAEAVPSTRAATHRSVRMEGHLPLRREVGHIDGAHGNWPAPPEIVTSPGIRLQLRTPRCPSERLPFRKHTQRAPPRVWVPYANHSQL